VIYILEMIVIIGAMGLVAWAVERRDRGVSK
jgi:hypothetical protein